jgi:hypothetical protein
MGMGPGEYGLLQVAFKLLLNNEQEQQRIKFKSKTKIKRKLKMSSR